jgi:hypothetical protein
VNPSIRALQTGASCQFLLGNAEAPSASPQRHGEGPPDVVSDSFDWQSVCSRCQASTESGVLQQTLSDHRAAVREPKSSGSPNAINGSFRGALNLSWPVMPIAKGSRRVRAAPQPGKRRPPRARCAAAPFVLRTTSPMPGLISPITCCVALGVLTRISSDRDRISGVGSTAGVLVEKLATTAV